MARLGAVEPALISIASEHVSFTDVPTPGGQLIRHLELCGKKMPFTSSLKSAREIAQRLVEEYGQRALQAGQNQGSIGRRFRMRCASDVRRWSSSRPAGSNFRWRVLQSSSRSSRVN